MSEHGHNRYTHGCRCDVCKAAKADYQREKRAAAREIARKHTTPITAKERPIPIQGRRLRAGDFRYVVPAALHGSPASYVELGCRCVPCTDAYSVKRGREQERRRARRRKVAVS